MRFPVVRLAAVVVGIVAVMSCDGGSVNPRFGNGIAGGSSGTAPVTPTNPNAPDTNKPFVRIDTPAVVGQLVNVGDSILTVTRIIDDRQLQSLVVTGYKFTGSANLGTLVQTIRYTPVFAPVQGGTPFRTGLTDTTIRRYLRLPRRHRWPTGGQDSSRSSGRFIGSEAGRTSRARVESRIAARLFWTIGGSSTRAVDGGWARRPCSPSRYGRIASVPGSAPSSCIRSANISVPTTEAALFRVTVESINPNAAIASNGHA